MLDDRSRHHFPTTPPSISAFPLPSPPSAYYCSPQSRDLAPTTNCEKTSPQPPNSSNPTHLPHESSSHRSHHQCPSANSRQRVGLLRSAVSSPPAAKICK